MYAQVMLILIDQCLLNVVVSIRKALIGQISLKYHFYYSYLSMLVFFLFLTPFFYFTPYKISTDQTPVGPFWLVC